MQRVIRSAAMLAAILACVAAAVGCDGGGDGDGGSTTLEDYFTELERISNDAETRLEAVATPDIGADAPFETSRDAFAQYYDDYATELEEVVAAFDALEPAEEAADEHERFVGAIGELPSVTYNYANGIRDAESAAGFQAAFANTAEGEAVAARVVEACNALQTIADESEIAVDLKCDA